MKTHRLDLSTTQLAAVAKGLALLLESKDPALAIFLRGADEAGAKVELATILATTGQQEASA